MGFFITDSILIDDFKVSVSNAYVTIRASYQQSKNGYGFNVIMPNINNVNSPYTLSCRYFIYASQSATKPLKEEWFNLPCDDIPENPIEALYNAIVSDKFSEKTIVNDL